MRRKFAGAALALLVAAACGSPSTNWLESGGSIDAPRADITEYQTLSAEVQSAATAYATTMAGTSVTTANCKSIHNQYDRRVRPWISRMLDMAGEMDVHIANHGGVAAADMMCAAASMLDEIDYHRSIACTFASLEADRDEAARDVSAIASYAGHVHTRCAEMLGGTDGTCCNWGPMMNGCANWTSTCCRSGMRWGCCGGMVTGGGMMHGGSCCGSGW